MTTPNTILFDVFASRNDTPEVSEFFVRVPARHMAEVLDMHGEGVNRVLRELIGQQMPESVVHHNGRGRFAGVTHTIRWCDR